MRIPWTKFWLPAGRYSVAGINAQDITTAPPASVTTKTTRSATECDMR